jgi:hypothetical protein
MSELNATEQARQLLIKNGYNALSYPGECACSIDDFAPCGECEKHDGEDYINDCDPSYKFIDPENKSFWVASPSNVAPTEQEWVLYRGWWL